MLSRNEPATSARLHTGEALGVRYISGSTIYDEALVDGRWIGRYWSAVGVIRPEKDIAPDVQRLAHHALDAFVLEIDGQSLGGHWQWEGCDIQPTPFGHSVAVRLRHAERPVAISVCTALDGTAIFRRWIEVTHLGERPAALSIGASFAGLLWRVAAPLELVRAGDPIFRLGSYQSAIWGHEGAFGWQDLRPGVTRIEGRRGRSGHGRPTLFLRNEASGELIVGDLAWSGNWAYQLRCEQDSASDEALLFLEIGPVAPAPQRVLAPGELVRTPDMHLGYLHSDLDGATQAMHTHLRHSVLPPQPADRNQRVTANHWGYVADRVTPDFLKRDIDVAAAVGCELYILDAGWYGTEPGTWYWTVGDWEPGHWMPSGVEQIRAYVRERGLLFGLWMEPECVGSQSRVYAEHPDWVIQRDGAPVGRVTPTGGHYALDLTKPDVAEWVEQQIGRIIEHYDLDLFRLDYNVDVWAGGENRRDGFLENTLWRHYEALYGIFERVRARFPQLILENCASGGGRTDLGIVSRFHTTWTSDWAQAPRGLAVLNGLTLALPPEVCNRIAGVMNPDEYLYGDLDFQLRVAFLGHPVFIGIGPAVDELVPAHRARVEHIIQLYKTFIRPLIQTCRVFHHTPVLQSKPAHGHCVLEYAAPDATRALGAIFRLGGAGPADYVFRPRGLSRGKQYQVTFDSSGETCIVSGLELQRAGLSVRLESPLTSELVLFEERP
ncbi:MAG: alpha-galactosidase [Roseiflexaceae bacterium]